MYSFMISCKKAAELTCARLDRPLSVRETILWRIHLSMCAACKGFQKQNEALLRLFERKFREERNGAAGANALSLPEDACERLKRRLDEAASDSPASD